MPKSQKSRQNQNHPANYGKRKSPQTKTVCISPCRSRFNFPSITLEFPKGYGMAQSQNGFASWGYLSLVGILGVVAASFMADKTRPYEGLTKQIALFAFAAITGGALVFLVRILTGSQTLGYGYTVKFSDIVKPGLGLFLCLIAGTAGLLWLMGIIKLPTPPSTPPNNPNPPPPPPTA